jgi:riboflavin synthase
MFTGLIEDVGAIVEFSRREGGGQISIEHSPLLDDLKLGDSIAVDGVCLTITCLEGNSFRAEVSAETIKRTTLSGKKPGHRVNLERALRLQDRLGGHVVTGHIDAIARVLRVVPEGNARKLIFQSERSCIRYLVEKGSVAVDGISLTVNEVSGEHFNVTIIPYTLEHTTLVTKKQGDEVNIETDILGKYVERLMGRDSDKKIDASFLSEHGFL